MNIHFSSQTNEWATKFNGSFTKIDSCFVWNKARNKDGYGVAFFEGKNITAHRLSYKLYYKSKLDNKQLCVCHKCDNTSCINPRHLFLATNQENTNDRYLKGRSAKGIQNGSSKLNESQVQSIRAKYIPRHYSIRKLAKEYNVCYATIRELLINKNWKYVK